MRRNRFQPRLSIEPLLAMNECSFTIDTDRIGFHLIQDLKTFQHTHLLAIFAASKNVLDQHNFAGKYCRDSHCFDLAFLKCAVCSSQKPPAETRFRDHSVRLVRRRLRRNHSTRVFLYARRATDLCWLNLARMFRSPICHRQSALSYRQISRSSICWKHCIFGCSSQNPLENYPD